MTKQDVGTVAITGATGFIGSHVVRGLLDRGFSIKALVRRTVQIPSGATLAVVGDLRRPLGLEHALAGVNAVVHCAGLAHEQGADADHYEINTKATIALARAAAAAGVKRFISISSVKAQCGASSPEIILNDAEPKPDSPYGLSKLEAERGLSRLDLDWAALRPTVVYGVGAKGNMVMVETLARSSWPLPLGSLRGRRSLLSVENLVDAVDFLMRADGQIRRHFLICDSGCPLTVAEMISVMRRARGRGPGIVRMPSKIIQGVCKMSGRAALYHRINGNLIVDAQALKEFGWSPRYATAEGLAQWASSWR